MQSDRAHLRHNCNLRPQRVFGRRSLDVPIASAGPEGSIAPQTARYSRVGRLGSTFRNETSRTSCRRCQSRVRRQSPTRRSAGKRWSSVVPFGTFEWPYQFFSTPVTDQEFQLGEHASIVDRRPRPGSGGRSAGRPVPPVHAAALPVTQDAFLNNLRGGETLSSVTRRSRWGHRQAGSRRPRLLCRSQTAPNPPRR